MPPNALGLVALEKIVQTINIIETGEYAELLAALSIRPKTLVQGALVLHEPKARSEKDNSPWPTSVSTPSPSRCAEEAANVRPCEDTRKPRNAKSLFYPVLRLVGPEDSDDGRRKCASKSAYLCQSGCTRTFACPRQCFRRPTKATRGEIAVKHFHALPPEFAEMQWRILDAGILGTS